MSITRHHNEWLSLVPNSGPFLSLPVLAQAFPQGLDAHDPDHARRLRMVFDEWDDNQLGRRPDPAIHRAWIKLVLEETLGYEELLAEGQAIPQTLKSDVAEYGVTLRPEWIVNDPAIKKARLLVQVYPRSQSLTKPVASSWWKTSPDTRMMQLLHDTNIRLGIVTNGDHWMLVNAPKNETTGYVSWYANLWLEEKDTLRAFRTLLCADRFFSVPENETLNALLDRSASDQQEVTDQLGYQVRKAVEVLIQAVDKADQNHGRKLLADVDERVLYESALTVMMRLVFLFCAEERELLLSGDDLYDKNYAVSTLRDQLLVAASEHSEDILGLRYDAWSRLLTTFRAVYAGAKHDRLKLPAYGGSLFNPDRFPFLEGRKLGTSWKTAEATPLPVSNRTVLHLLEALQVLQVRLPGGGAAEARKLSFRSLDIEQIGHVYEGLLDHTAKRATEPVLGLQGTRDKEPEIPLAELEKIVAKGEKELLKFLKDQTGRSESALKKGLTAEIDGQTVSRFGTACQDSLLWKRVKPFAGLVRLDTVGYPLVITTGSVFVTAGTDRRSSGTHYTPKSLTEPIVEYTLEPLVKVGPAEGLPREQWKLRSAKELLDLKICDMACGSGAFLVQACRYMAARLLEAWDSVQRANPGTVRITPEGEPSTGHPGEMLIPDDPDERQTYALRIVAQRCLYGVDKNPLAAEMAKLSLWLLTLAKDKPFEFLDHAIRCGDSLVGIHNTEQLRKFNLDGKGEDNTLFLQFLDPKINEAITLRSQITEMQANTVEDVEAQDRMLREANEKIDRLRCAADMLISAEFVPGSTADKRAARDEAAIKVAVHFNGSDLPTFRREAQSALAGQVTFHWPLEFPEVLVEGGGFDAFVGNPPFMSGSRISTRLGQQFYDFLRTRYSSSVSGQTDLCAFFFLRAYSALRGNGTLGFVATNTISQGDTQRAALGAFANSTGVIYRAVPSTRWPGNAAVVISLIHISKGDFKGKRFLGERLVDSISPALDECNDDEEIRALQENAGLSHAGSHIYGPGFTLSATEAHGLIVKDARNKQVLAPFLRGEDFNSDPQQRPSKWVINFHDWPLSLAEQYVDCMEIVREKVKPQRDQVKRKIYRERWWLYAERQRTLYETIKGLSRVLFHAFTSKYLCFAFVPPDYVYATPHVVVASSSTAMFASLQNTFHELWIRRVGSTLKQDLRYTPTDCFQKYPRPRLQERLLNEVGERYYECRQQIMLSRHVGLTAMYNRFHASSEDSEDIQKLRQLHVEMNNAVAAAYGWTDLALGHGFHETKQGVRYTIRESARRAVLARLLKLNHERYAEEVKQGLHEKKPKSTKGKKKTEAADTVRTLFGRTTMNDDVCYFAYGSNLWIDQKEQRTSAIRSGDDRPRLARLANYRLAFNKLGSEGQVFANIMACPGDEVIGIAYRCRPSTIDSMSEREGGYERLSVQVVIEDDSSVEAVTFVAMERNVVNEGRPSDEYLERIVTGARQHELPDEYIEKMKKLASGSEV
jgi:cation transport regulator ChaC